MKITSLIFSVITFIFFCAEIGNSQTNLDISASAILQNDSFPSTQQKNEAAPSDDFHIKYNLEEPDQIFELPKILNEISGLSFNNSYEKLYAVQDENGIIFIMDRNSGKVEQEIEFHKDGDYEGIEVVGETVYVVKSTGTIYEITNAGHEGQEMEKYNLFLSRENDVEGLCFDKATNKLLLACKGVPATGESFEIIRYKKVVYGFDIDTKEIDTIPVYNIQLEDIQKCLHTNSTIRDSEKLTSHFSSEHEDLNFNPSAIAIHPITKNIYVLSSSGKTLIVMSYKGEIIYIERLNKEIHQQPEGIVFDTDGTLYISNEGKKDSAKIYRFNYRN